MRARLFFACLASVSAASSWANESRSTSYRNLSLGGGGAASVSAPAPARAAPRPVARAAQAPSAPAPPPAPRSSGPALWLAAAVAALLALAAAARARAGRRDESLALAAHELKSPLAAIEAYLALMEQDGRSGAADVRSWLEDVARMRSTAAHLRRTIGDMLEMTRLEDGRLRLEPREFDLTALARECAGAYRALAAQAGVALAVEGGPVHAWADPGRSRQILDNLIGNALRHTPSGGTVTIACAADGAGARAAVRDDGAGVPAERRESLFTRFARVSEPLRGEAGTGLGLYIGRRLAEASGGRLEYAPGPGERGSVFTLTLPGERT